VVRSPHSPRRPPQLSLRGGTNTPIGQLGVASALGGGLATPKWSLVLLSLSLFLSLLIFQPIPSPTSLHWFPSLLIRSLPLLHPSILVQKLLPFQSNIPISTLNLMRFIEGNGKACISWFSSFVASRYRIIVGVTDWLLDL
jgi:hypothetical protein